MKKLIALFLVLVLFASLIPAASADEVDDLLTFLRTYLPEHGFGDSFKLRRVGRVVQMNMWSDGFAELAELAATNAETAVSWRQVVESLAGLAGVVQGMFDEYGTIVVFTLVDDRDLKTPVVTIADGGVLYDAAIGAESYD